MADDPAVVAGESPTGEVHGGEVLRVSRSVAIPLSALEWRFSASSGPGGQHANTANTRAEVRVELTTAPGIGPRQRTRLVGELGEVVRVVASDRRSQAQNRALALERLRSKLAAALVTTAPRVATRPSKAAKRRRVDDKRRRGEVKAARRRPMSAQD